MIKPTRSPQNAVAAELHGIDADLGVRAVDGDRQIGLFHDQADEPFLNVELALVDRCAAVDVGGTILGLLASQHADVLLILGSNGSASFGNGTVDFLADDNHDSLLEKTI